VVCKVHREKSVELFIIAASAGVECTLILGSISLRRRLGTISRKLTFLFFMARRCLDFQKVVLSADIGEKDGIVVFICGVESRCCFCLD
jgi:hypothetical protein